MFAVAHMGYLLCATYDGEQRDVTIPYDGFESHDIFYFAFSGDILDPFEKENFVCCCVYLFTVLAKCVYWNTCR